MPFHPTRDKSVSSRERLIIYRVFVLYYGTPRLGGASYDPDSRLFSVKIVGNNVGIFNSMLADRIMNDQAKQYERRIKKAKLRVYLRLSKGVLFLDGGYLIFPDGTRERLLPYHKKEFQLKHIVVAVFPRISVPHLYWCERNRSERKNE